MISARISLWSPVVLYMGFIFTLSSIARTPSFPSGADKYLHAALYGGLGALLVRALAGGWRGRITLRIAVAAVVMSAAYGVTDEIHQHFVPPRQVEALDVVADAVGAAFSAMALHAWWRAVGAGREGGPV